MDSCEVYIFQVEMYLQPELSLVLIREVALMWDMSLNLDTAVTLSGEGMPEMKRWDRMHRATEKSEYLF